MKLKNKILTLIAGTLTTFALTSCNDFLDRDPLGQFTEDDAPNALIGGKMYNVYYLMRSYNITAGIPAFMIHMVRSEDSEKGSDAGDGADQAAMWDDFQYTASNGTLSAYWGRITWGAARSLHARTYMMRNDWDNMYDASTEVVKSGIYNLNTPVDKVFTVEGENCGESVFELQCESTDALKNSDVIGSQFCQVQGVRGAGEWDLGWGWHMGTTLVGQAFEAGDPRKDASLLYFRRSISEPVTPENTNKPYGESPVSTAMGAYFNKKAYTSPELRKKYTKDGFWVNIRIIRYPDVLLMAAEAANEKGIPGEAIDYLEQVRAHARGTDSSILPKVTSTDQSTLREAIRHERRVELALEPDRFYDLVRWGIAKEVLQAAGKNYQDKNALLPLPQEEIDKSNGVLVQNPND